MASAPPLPFISVEEYLRTSYEPECEYVDGVLVPKEMPKRTHALVQRLLMLMLAKSAGSLGLDFYGELRMRVSATRTRVPDVVVFEGKLLEEIASRPPLLTVEIASDTEPMLSLKEKLRDHLSMGTRVAVIIDPHDRTVMVQDTGRLRSLEGRNLLRLETEKGVLEIDFDALFTEMDQELNG